MKPSAALLFLLFLALALHGLQARTWTDVDGRSLEADYLAGTETSVQVRRAVDQQVFELQLDQLSQGDRDFVAERLAADLGFLHTPDEFEFAHFRPRLEGFRFGNNRVPAKYLGIVSLREKTLGPIEYWPDGMSISANLPEKRPQHQPRGA